MSDVVEPDDLRDAIELVSAMRLREPGNRTAQRAMDRHVHSPRNPYALAGAFLHLIDTLHEAHVRAYNEANPDDPIDPYSAWAKFAAGVSAGLEDWDTDDD